MNKIDLEFVDFNVETLTKVWHDHNSKTVQSIYKYYTNQLGYHRW